MSGLDRSGFNVVGGNGFRRQFVRGDGFRRQLVRGHRVCVDGLRRHRTRRQLFRGHRPGGNGVCNYRIGRNRVCQYRSRRNRPGNNRPVRNRAGANRPRCNLRPGNDSPRKLLPGYAHAVQHGAHRPQGHLGVAPRDAVECVVRDSRLHFYARRGADHPHAVANVHVVQFGDVPAFHRVANLHKVHVHRQRRHVASRVKFLLRRFPHLGVGFVGGQLALALAAHARVAHFQYAPFGIGVIVDIRAVNVTLRQIQRVSVLVFAHGHKPGDHVAFVLFHGKALQVFLFPDGHRPVDAHPVNGVNVPPVPGKLRLPRVRQTLVTQQRLHRIFLRPFRRSRGGHFAVHHKSGWGLAFRKYLRRNLARRRALRLVILHQVVR